MPHVPSRVQVVPRARWAYLVVGARVQSPDFDNLVRLMKYKCACCHRFKRQRSEVRRFVVKCGLIDAGQWKLALELDREIAGCAGQFDTKLETKRTLEEEVLTRHEANLKRYRQAVAGGKRAKHVLHTHERQTREKIVKEFMKGMPVPSRKCMNCGAFSPLLRKDGYTKIFQKDLLPKQKKSNKNNGTVFKPLLSDGDLKAVLKEAQSLDQKMQGSKKSKKKKMLTRSTKICNTLPMMMTTTKISTMTSMSLRTMGHVLNDASNI